LLVCAYNFALRVWANFCKPSIELCPELHAQPHPESYAYKPHPESYAYKPHPASLVEERWSLAQTPNKGLVGYKTPASAFNKESK